jgi:transcriptional regulator with XRE-family HTH domain
MPLSERIKEFLDEKEISQKDFCDKTGYNDRTFSNVLTGRTKVPKIDLVEAFIRFYPEVDIRWLILGDGEMETDTSAPVNIADKLESMESVIDHLSRKMVELDVLKEQVNKMKSGREGNG